MNINTFLTLIACTFNIIYGVAQTPKKKEIIATYKTNQETIDKINSLMGIKTNKKRTKKGIVLTKKELRKRIEEGKRTTLAAKKNQNSNQKVDYLTEQLINVAKTYRGVRYKWGGMSRRGMDCSGFVKTAFDTFNVNLPRTSRAMAMRGNKVSKHNAKPGDLIFFRNGRSRVINHVGIVIEVEKDELKFIHSASSKGVSIASTKNSYWKRNFYQINRVYNQNTF